MNDMTPLLVTPETTIREAITVIDSQARGIALVVDEEQRLIHTVTDGDIRRAVLDGLALDTTVRTLLERKATRYARPVTASAGTPPAELLQLMQTHVVRQVPLLDEAGHVVDLVTMSDLLPDPPDQALPMQAVVMAGGFGTRLRPLTEDIPKPMLPVGGRPLMERIIDQLRQTGVRNINVTTHYKPEKITEYFGNGQAFGVNISYVAEDRPLGTAGALSLMDAPAEPLLVINGDILTRVDFRSLLDYHREHQADLTVGVRQYSLQVPYGVIECEGAYVRRLREKPQLSFLVNAGIYLLEPSAHTYIPNQQRFDMTDLIEVLVAEGRTVVSFPIVEYWLDIGQHIDYEQAQQDIKLREGSA